MRHVQEARMELEQQQEEEEEEEEEDQDLADHHTLHDSRVCFPFLCFSTCIQLCHRVYLTQRARPERLLVHEALSY